MKNIFCTLLAGLMAHLSMAHSLWIEAPSSGIKNKAQEIKVYYGEFADKEISLTKDWYSNTKDFTIVAIGPDGKEQPLSKTIADDHYKVAFTPTQEGIYTIALKNSVEKIYEGTKIHYYSNAHINVNKTNVKPEVPATVNKLSIINYDADQAKKDKSMRVIALLDGQPAAFQEIKVFAPNGWAKIIWSNKEGEIEFTPLWTGKYQIEYTHTDVTTQEENGNRIDKIWSATTYTFMVN